MEQLSWGTEDRQRYPSPELESLSRLEKLPITDEEQNMVAKYLIDYNNAFDMYSLLIHQWESHGQYYGMGELEYCRLLLKLGVDKVMMLKHILAFIVEHEATQIQSGWVGIHIDKLHKYLLASLGHHILQCCRVENMVFLRQVLLIFDDNFCHVHHRHGSLGDTGHWFFGARSTDIIYFYNQDSSYESLIGASHNHRKSGRANIHDSCVNSGSRFFSIHSMQGPISSLSSPAIAEEKNKKRKVHEEDRRSRERSREVERGPSKDRERGDSREQRDYDRRSRDCDRHSDRDRGYDRVRERDRERSRSHDSRSRRRSRSRSKERSRDYGRDYDRSRRHDRDRY